MSARNNGYRRQQRQGFDRAGPQEIEDIMSRYPRGHAKRVRPTAEYVDNEDYYLRREDYVEYDHLGGRHSERARNDYSYPMSRRYDSTSDFGRGGSHFVEDRRSLRRSNYDSSYDDNPANYDMQRQVHKRSAMHVSQRNGHCFSRQGDAPLRVYKQRKEPTRRIQLTENEAGIQKKETTEVKTCGSTSREKLVEEDKSKKQGPTKNTPKVEGALNSTLKVEVASNNNPKVEGASNKTPEVEQKMDVLQKMGLENREMKVQLKVMQHKLDDQHSVQNKKIDELTKQLQEKMDQMDFMESLSHTVVIKEPKCNDELQDDIRNELINGFLAHPSPRAHIGIKRMGELDPKEFSNAFGRTASAKNSEFTAVFFVRSGNLQLKTPNGTLSRLSWLMDNRRR